MTKKATPPLSPAPGLSRALRRYLYFTAAVTGAAIMVVEILGAKMLSPFVGMSHFVWTAQIAVTLVALASGYYAGGRLADRTQKLSGLYWAILAGASYLALTVTICEPVAYWCLDFNLAVGSLLASTILFFIPLALLAMTGPFLIRVLTSTVAGVGGNVGRLTAISTLGSFAGTLLIGYFMIPFLPNTVTMFGTAVVLMLVAAGYFGAFRRQFAGPLSLGLVVACFTGFVLRQELARQPNWITERFRGNSYFGQLQVLDSRVDSKRYYLNDYLTQNSYDTERKQSRSQFTYVLAGLARVYATNLQDVLCIGLGVGIVPMDFARRGVRVDVVEINPGVVPVAERFFDLEPAKLHLIIDDGRHFLNRSTNRYDAVILDAFLGDSSPSHLMSREAFESIRRVLHPGGVLVINSFGDLEDGRDFFAASLYRTLQTVFQSVKIHSNGDGAMFFAASDRPELAFVRAPDLEGAHPEILFEAKSTFAQTVQPIPGHGRVLTDNFNPAEYYDARNREELRRRLAKSAREL